MLYSSSIYFVTRPSLSPWARNDIIRSINPSKIHIFPVLTHTHTQTDTVKQRLKRYTRESVARIPSWNWIYASHTLSGDSLYVLFISDEREARTRKAQNNLFKVTLSAQRDTIHPLFLSPLVAYHTSIHTYIQRLKTSNATATSSYDIDISKIARNWCEYACTPLKACISLLLWECTNIMCRSIELAWNHVPCTNFLEILHKVLHRRDCHSLKGTCRIILLFK